MKRIILGLIIATILVGTFVIAEEIINTKIGSTDLTISETNTLKTFLSVRGFNDTLRVAISNAECKDNICKICFIKEGLIKECKDFTESDIRTMQTEAITYLNLRLKELAYQLKDIDLSGKDTTIKSTRGYIN